MKITFKGVLAIVFMFTWLALLCFGFISCGAKKQHSEKEKESSSVEVVDRSTDDSKIEKKEESETNVKRSEETIVNNQDHTVTKKETIEPVDNTKPASYKDESGKMQELNNSKKTTETTTKKNNTKSESKVNTEVAEKKSKDSIGEQKKNNNIIANGKAERTKKVDDLDQKQFNWFSLWWLYLIIIGLILLALKKFTKIFG